MSYNLVLKEYELQQITHGYNTELVLVKIIISNITINFPSLVDFYGKTPPSFGISTFDSNIDSTWYTLDRGIVNITFSGLSGAIDQTEWDKQGNGMVFIRFYMNNSIDEVRKYPYYLFYSLI